MKSAQGHTQVSLRCQCCQRLPSWRQPKLSTPRHGSSLRLHTLGIWSCTLGEGPQAYQCQLPSPC